MKTNAFACAYAAFIFLSATTATADCAVYQHRDFGGSYWWLAANDRLVMIEGESVGTTTNGHCPECESTTYYEPSWNDEVSEALCTCDS